MTTAMILIAMMLMMAMLVRVVACLRFIFRCRAGLYAGVNKYSACSTVSSAGVNKYAACSTVSKCRR